MVLIMYDSTGVLLGWSPVQAVTVCTTVDSSFEASLTNTASIGSLIYLCLYIFVWDSLQNKQTEVVAVVLPHLKSQMHIEWAFPDANTLSLHIRWCTLFQVLVSYISTILAGGQS